ncbi:hypothetical protein [Acidihalobacter ferrooxydans]|uniref:Glycosyltransferase RgtA/B/C/D-like domain-containing protein n=1 Tax=Acidihalobacter ferrooxydans TaxID=1765967 RepID=A0A1P8UJI0_9GAMM|nr:hypothetical protein [Acidihalobacter ferrooxydans]APZ43960.1 hypothetical protein BW247_13375 [Acidihalobacter ferrooxydans]
MRQNLTLAAGLLLAVAATVLIYWPGIHGPFLLDDFANIVNNPALKLHHLSYNALMAAAFSSDAGPLHRPIAMVSFALNEYFVGPGAASMKATNIFIHAFNGVLVYAVAALTLTAYRRRFRPDLTRGQVLGTALAIAAAWLVLPINLTAVLYVVQRMTSFSATFALGGIALYLWGRLRLLDGRRGLWMLWTGIALGGGLAVLTKEDGALLPVYTLVLEWALFGFARASGGRDRRLYLLYALLLLAPGILGLIWLWPGIAGSFQHSGRPFTIVERLLTEPRVFFDYIYWTLAPNLGALSLYHDDYPFSTGLLAPPTTLLSILGIVALLAVAVWLRRRRPLIALGIVWFFAGQLMTGTFFDLELVFEQRNYIPDIGLLLIVFGTVLLERPVEKLLLARRTLVVALIVLYALILGLRVQEWSNGLRLAEMQASMHPHSPRATYSLGRILAVAATREPHNIKLIKTTTRALNQSAAIPGSSLLADQALLILYAQIHQPYNPAWWSRIDHKLRTQPMSAQNLVSLQYMVTCEVQKHCVFPQAQMQQVFDIATRRFARNPKLLSVYANWLLNIRREPLAARAVMERCVELDPRTPQYWINLIRLDIALYRFKDARDDIAQLAKYNHLGQLDDTLRSLRRQLHDTEQTFVKQVKNAQQKSAHKGPPGG